MRANIIVFFTALLLLSGCGGGSSGANGTTPFDDSSDPVIALSIEVLDSNCVAVEDNIFTTDQSICVQATLTSDGSAFSGQVVNFALGAAVGTLSDGTALTNASGVAQVTISNTEAATGATTITATYDTSTTASESFQYNESDEPPVNLTPTVSLEMIVDGANSIRFRVGENVAVRSTILDANGAPVTDEIVRFTTTSSDITISPDASLTDNTGTARATLSGIEAAIGAHELTATITIDGVTYSNTSNFELLEADPQQSNRQLSLAVLNANCEAEDQSFNTNETICIQANLTQNGTPVQNEIVSFSISGDLGNLSATTALTNSAGNAAVNITNASATIGAATVTATFDTLTESSNYEYVAVSDTTVDSPNILVEIVLTGNSVNGFQVGEEALVRATVTDPSGEPVPDSIVTFNIQGTGPILTPATALTNISGVAEVDITATETDLGAYAVQGQVTVNDILISNSVNFEVRSSGAVVDSETRFGHFNSDGIFVEGSVGSTLVDEGEEVVISAGATTGFDVALVDENDQRVTTPTPVTFTSTCVSNGDATIDESVTTINGVASATFEDLSCAGATGNIDQIVASVVVNNATITITRDISIQPEGIGSISFLSATPDSIVLNGTGGQNNESVSTLVFQVNGELGNPLAQQEVSFLLNTTVGGLRLDPATGLTNSAGQVSTRVTAGTVPTPVRVTARVNTADDIPIQTQSDILTVNTGLPDQNSFTLSASVLNVEGADFSGTTSIITARLADSFNNPVPNGTTVQFTSESGSIDGACRTGESESGEIDPNAAPTGTCSVTWTSASPVTPDHRSTVLAFAIGHETLFDSNGNNAYDDSDGGPIIDGTDSGFSVSGYGQIGFVDHSEAWRDDDEDGIRDESEQIFDFNGNGNFDGPDGLFNGPQCNSETLCDSNAASINIRRALVLITSSSSALWRIYASSDFGDSSNIISTNDPNITITNARVLADDDGYFFLEDGESADIYIVYYDSAEQLLPSGTQLGTVDPDGNISVIRNTVNNTNQRESTVVPGTIFRLVSQENETGANSDVTSYQFAIETPLGVRTAVDFNIRLN